MVVHGFEIDADFLENRGIGIQDWLKLHSAYPQLRGKDQLLLRVFDYINGRGLGIDSRHVIVNLIQDPFGLDDIEIIPTIEAYRAIAHNSGDFVGGCVIEEGPMQERDYAGITVRAPEYLVYSVKRLVNGHEAQWIAKEYFTENIVLDQVGRPVDFWRQRPIGQLTIRAEAQALRRAFRAIDNYTAEELSVADNGSGRVLTHKVASGKLNAEAGNNALDAQGAAQDEIPEECMPEDDKTSQVSTGEAVESILEDIATAATHDLLNQAVADIPELDRDEVTQVMMAYQEKKQALSKAC